MGAKLAAKHRLLEKRNLEEKGKLCRKNKETKVRIAHIIEAGWPRGGKNGGRVLEVSLCHCTACHPLPSPHPFSVIYNDQIVPLEECCEWV